MNLPQLTFLATLILVVIGCHPHASSIDVVGAYMSTSPGTNGSELSPNLALMRDGKCVIVVFPAEWSRALAAPGDSVVSGSGSWRAVRESGQDLVKLTLREVTGKTHRTVQVVLPFRVIASKPHPGLEFTTDDGKAVPFRYYGELFPVASKDGT
jgi:hypothetical protein